MKICVIGTGTMAKGIVKAFAAKMPVVMKSRTQASLDKAMASIAKGYGKLVEKGKMTQEAVDALLKNIVTTTDYATFADADLVIEAAVEEMQLKKDVFTELDGICIQKSRPLRRPAWKSWKPYWRLPADSARLRCCRIAIRRIPIPSSVRARPWK